MCEEGQFYREWSGLANWGTPELNIFRLNIKNTPDKWIHLQAFFYCAELNNPPASTSMILLLPAQSLRYLLVQITCYCLLPLGAQCSFGSGHLFSGMATLSLSKDGNTSNGSGTFTFQKGTCDVSLGKHCGVKSSFSSFEEWYFTVISLKRACGYLCRGFKISCFPSRKMALMITSNHVLTVS